MKAVSMANFSKTDYQGPTSTRRYAFGDDVNVTLIRPLDPDVMLDAPDVVAWNRSDDYMPYWAYLWEGAYLLAETVAKEPGMTGKTVLEIGCGLGLAGLAAVGRGAHTIFTDYDEAPFPFIERSARASEFAPERFSTERLDWRNLPSDRRYPWIIGADVIYEAKLVPLVANLIVKLLEPGGTALLTTPYRVAAQGFVATAESVGLTVTSETIEVETVESGLVRGTLYRVVGKN